MTEETKTFTFGEAPSVDHEVGATQCRSCWKDETDECVCGGWIHSQFEDLLVPIREPILIQISWACDRCGEDYEIATNG